MVKRGYIGAKVVSTDVDKYVDPNHNFSILSQIKFVAYDNGKVYVTSTLQTTRISVAINVLSMSF